jgi:hypothetical protein
MLNIVALRRCDAMMPTYISGRGRKGTVSPAHFWLLRPPDLPAFRFSRRGTLFPLERRYP